MKWPWWLNVVRLWQVFQSWRLHKKLEHDQQRYMDHTGNLVTVKKLLDRRLGLQMLLLQAQRKNDVAATAKYAAQLELLERLLDGGS